MKEKEIRYIVGVIKIKIRWEGRPKKKNFFLKLEVAIEQFKKEEERLIYKTLNRLVNFSKEKWIGIYEEEKRKTKSCLGGKEKRKMNCLYGGGMKRGNYFGER